MTVQVDAHSHLVPESLLAVAAERGADHGVGVSRDAAGGWHAWLPDGSRRAIHPGLYDLERRWRRIEEQDIGFQVVSGWNEFYGYHLSRRDGRWWARLQNKHLAAIIADQPARLAGLGVVPLQDVGDAVAELRYAIGSLGLVGVVVNTNIQGHNLDEPSLVPFWRTLADLGVLVMVHPSISGGLATDRLAKYSLANVVGNPT